MPVEARIPTRMGDGFMAEMTRSELRADIEQATTQAAAKAKAPPLTADEQAQLLDIYASPAAFTAVDIGDQVVLSCDGGEGRRRRVNVEQVPLLLGGERRRLGFGRRLRGPLLDVRAQLAARHLDHETVAH